MAAPHTRGSTRDHRPAASGSAGCPAHAGIDPRKRRVDLVRKRLPRTRGDRPCNPTLTDGRAGAAPHTRGSTRARAHASQQSVGCPAHAGIDPAREDRSSALARLPRTRGDRPEKDKRPPRISEAAPHTRGSTREGSLEALGADGCPAHAGIDPLNRDTPASPVGLPRTRGDRPEALREPWHGGVAAPHTRGSTHVRAVDMHADRGCPAHAGIDPRAVASRLVVRWLPRTRGDRPFAADLAEIGSEAAPHTRGSTRGRRAHAGAVLGCPAHAGIDPKITAEINRELGLPRTRGDRPPLNGPLKR